MAIDVSNVDAAINGLLSGTSAEEYSIKEGETERKFKGPSLTELTAARKEIVASTNRPGRRRIIVGVPA